MLSETSVMAAAVVHSSTGSEAEHGSTFSTNSSLREVRRCRQQAAKRTTQSKLASAFSRIEELEQNVKQRDALIAALQEQCDGSLNASGLVCSVVQKEGAERLKCLEPCLVAQQTAANEGRPTHTSRSSVAPVVQARGNLNRPQRDAAVAPAVQLSPAVAQSSVLAMRRAKPVEFSSVKFWHIQRFRMSPCCK